MRSVAIFGALFPGVMAVAEPAINPLTVTSLTPSQVSAYVNGQFSLFNSFVPAITSLANLLETNPSAYSALTSLNDAIDSDAFPTGAAAVSKVNSLIDTLPTDLRPMYKSLVSAEITLLSKVVNSGVSAATAVTSSGSSPSGSGAGAGGSSTNSKNAAPTSGMVKAAGVAAGAFAAVVVML